MHTNTDLMKSLSRSPSYRQCKIVAHVAVLSDLCEKQRGSRKGRNGAQRTQKKQIVASFAVLRELSEKQKASRRERKEGAKDAKKTNRSDLWGSSRTLREIKRFT